MSKHTPRVHTHTKSPPPTPCNQSPMMATTPNSSPHMGSDPHWATTASPQQGHHKFPLPFLQLPGSSVLLAGQSSGSSLLLKHTGHHIHTAPVAPCTQELLPHHLQSPPQKGLPGHAPSSFPSAFLATFLFSCRSQNSPGFVSGRLRSLPISPDEDGALTPLPAAPPTKRGTRHTAGPQGRSMGWGKGVGVMLCGLNERDKARNDSQRGRTVGSIGIEWCPEQGWRHWGAPHCSRGGVADAVLERRVF